MSKPGDRVGAILSASNGECQFLGFGVYVGDEVPPEYAGGFNAGLPNPKIQLDSGKEVFGCECWWGPELSVKERLSKYDKIIEIDIDDARKPEPPEAE